MPGRRSPRNNEVIQLQIANLFRPQWIFDFTNSELAERTLNEFGRLGPDDPPSPDWREGAATGSSPEHADATLGDPRFLYAEKLPPTIVDEMHRRGLLSPAPGGYLVERPELLDRLLAAYACVLHQTSGNRLVPDTRTPVDSRRLAAPSLGVQTQHALATSLPGVVAPNLSTDIRRFIDFRKATRTNAIAATTSKN